MDFSPLVSLIASHQWVAVAALIIGAVVRLLKSDTPLPTVPARWRAWLAIGLGIVAGVLDALVAGTPLVSAVLQGLGAALTAITTHELVIEGIRGGRELGQPPGAAIRAVVFVGALSVLSACAAVKGLFTPQNEIDVMKPAICVLEHITEPPRQILNECAGTTLASILAIVNGQQAAEQERAMAGIGVCK